MSWRALAGRGPVVGIVVAVLVAVGPRPGSPAGFTVDPSRSALVVQIFKDGVAARLAHDHVVQARVFSGAVAYDPRNPDASSIQMTVEVQSLLADDPATRRKFGVSGEPPSESDRAEIEKAMKGEGQLAAARYPSMSFRSTAITRQPDGRFLVRGRLTIRGVTNEVQFPAEIGMDGADFRGRARLAFKQSSFGYQPYSAVLGAIKNKDEVILHIDLAAKAP